MLLPRLACHWNLPEGGPLRKYTDSTGHNRVSKVASPHLTHPVSWLARSRRPDSDLAGGPHSSCPSFPLFYRSPYLWNTNHSLLDICFLSLFFLLEYRSWVKSWETTEGAQSGFLPRVDIRAMVFPVVIHGCESWTIKKAECFGIVDASNCGVGEDSWESLGFQGDQTSHS